MPRRSHNTTKVLTIAMLALITGTLDAIVAIAISYPVGPAMVFRNIASGFFDHAAFTQEHMVLWGIFFHYLIAAFFSMAFWAIYPKFKSGIKNKYIIGILFGLITWVVMNFAVLPLTDIPKQSEHTPVDWVMVIKGIAALIICVGLPISIISERYYLRKAKRAARRRVRNNYS